MIFFTIYQHWLHEISAAGTYGCTLMSRALAHKELLLKHSYSRTYKTYNLGDGARVEKRLRNTKE